MRGWAWAAALGALLALGCTGPRGVLLEVRTDFVAGVEFSRVETRLLAPGTGFDGEVSETSVHQVDGSVNYGRGTRVAEFPEIEGEVARLRVLLLDAAGATVAERPVEVRLLGLTAVTAVLTRSCGADTCGGTSAGGTACLGGTCVDPGCTPEAPERCPAAACESAADCPDPEPSCARAACEGGACLVLDDGETCGAGLACHPVRGCVADSAPLLTLEGPASINYGSCGALDVTGGLPPYEFEVEAGEARADATRSELCSDAHGGPVTLRVQDSVGTAARVIVEVGGDSLFHIGGKSGDSFETGYTADVYRSDDDGATWAVVGTLPAPRYRGTGLVADDALWYFGGRTSMAEWHPDIYRSEDGVAWERVGALPYDTAGHSMTRSQGRWLSVGGFADEALIDAVATSVDGVTWEMEATFPTRIYGGSLVALDGRYHYLAGVIGTTRTDGRWSADDPGAWTAAATPLPVACFWTGFAMHRGTAFLVGGVECERSVVASTDRLESFASLGALPMDKQNGTLLVHHDALLYVSGSDSAEVLRSDDGIEWDVVGDLPVPLHGGVTVSFSPR